MAEGQAPPNIAAGAGCLIASLTVILFSLIPFLFPTTVFAPQPLKTISPAELASALLTEVRATGRFQRLKSVEPKIIIGRGRRNFTNAVANIIWLPGSELMVYIRHIVRAQYGITSQTDWGIFLRPETVTAAETGKLYGWKDRWAVRLEYIGPHEKRESLIISFGQPAAQARFVAQLKQAGFWIGSQYTI